MIFFLEIYFFFFQIKTEKKQNKNTLVLCDKQTIGPKGLSPYYLPALWCYMVCNIDNNSNFLCKDAKLFSFIASGF